MRNVRNLSENWNWEEREEKEGEEQERVEVVVVAGSRTKNFQFGLNFAEWELMDVIRNPRHSNSADCIHNRTCRCRCQARAAATSFIGGRGARGKDEREPVCRLWVCKVATRRPASFCFGQEGPRNFVLPCKSPRLTSAREGGAADKRSGGAMLLRSQANSTQRR